MDKRIVKRLAEFQDDIKTKQKVAIRQIASSHKEEMAYYRLLNNKQVTENYLLEKIQESCKKETTDKHVLIISDSSDMDYSSQRNRIKPNSGLGFIGDGGGLGYNCHVSLAADADSAAIYGLSDIFLWNRPEKTSDYRKLYNAQARLNQLKKNKPKVRGCQKRRKRN